MFFCSTDAPTEHVRGLKVRDGGSDLRQECMRVARALEWFATRICHPDAVAFVVHINCVGPSISDTFGRS